MNAFLQLNNLSAGYYDNVILHDINLALEPGQFTCIIAPNGAGKSTLLKTVAGLLPPLGGKVLLDNNELPFYNRRELARKIAMVGTNFPMHDYTVQQMVMMGRFAHIGRLSAPSKGDYAIVQNAIADVGLSDKRLCPCGEISQGERQKVLIARALAQQPSLLLLDEPTAHLDIANQFIIMELVKQLAADKKITVLAVLHDINLALEYSSSLLLLHQGGILAYGDTRTVASSANLKTLYGLDFVIHNRDESFYVRPARLR